jgi:bacterioferritin-associated ferredoxin
VIICSCNGLTEAQVRATLDRGPDQAPRSAGRVYGCLGCKPNCGRCLITIQRILEAEVSCAVCPGRLAANNDAEEQPFLIAAE